MLSLKNLADATLASLSILRKSRWRPKWPLNIWFCHNLATDCIQCVFYMQISTDIALFINTRGDGILNWTKKKEKNIKTASETASKMAAK